MVGANLLRVQSVNPAIPAQEVGCQVCPPGPGTVECQRWRGFWRAAQIRTKLKPAGAAPGSTNEVGPDRALARYRNGVSYRMSPGRSYQDVAALCPWALHLRSREFKHPINNVRLRLGCCERHV